MATGFHFLLNIVSGREWYEDDTISVTKNGVINNILNINSGSVESTTIIIKVSGNTNTTSDL